MEREDLLRTIYDAFNARDIDAVLRHMTRDGLITRMDVVDPGNIKHPGAR